MYTGAACLFLITLVLAAAVPPPAPAPPINPSKPTTGPIWPLSWNSTWYFIETNSSKIIDYGMWWYDATSMPGYLRMDNMLCAHNVQPLGVSCMAIFRDNALYWNMPKLNSCCVCDTDLAITGPDWIVNSTYVGVGLYNITNVWSYIWNRPAPFNWPYYETIPTPQTFNARLPEANRGDGTDLEWVNWLLGPQPSDAFDLPSYGCTTKCNSTAFPGCGMTDLPKRSVLRHILPARA